MTADTRTDSPNDKIPESPSVDGSVVEALRDVVELKERHMEIYGYEKMHYLLEDEAWNRASAALTAATSKGEDEQTSTSGDDCKQSSVCVCGHPFSSHRRDWSCCYLNCGCGHYTEAAHTPPTPEVANDRKIQSFDHSSGGSSVSQLVERLRAASGLPLDIPSLREIAERNGWELGHSTLLLEAAEALTAAERELELRGRELDAKHAVIANLNKAFESAAKNCRTNFDLAAAADERVRRLERDVAFSSSANADLEEELEMFESRVRDLETSLRTVLGPDRGTFINAAVRDAARSVLEGTDESTSGGESEIRPSAGESE